MIRYSHSLPRKPNRRTLIHAVQQWRLAVPGRGTLSADRSKSARTLGHHYSTLSFAFASAVVCLHVARRVSPAALQRHDVVNNVASASARDFEAGAFGEVLLKPAIWCRAGT